jgi:tRNA U55 pseudouridine synthase TruB
MFVLSGSALILWLVPLTALDKRISWHKAIQGLSLISGIACAVSAGNIARKLANENEIEEIKTRAITADVVDEIATSAYVSQSQRQQEAEFILTANSQPETENNNELDSIRESLELLISKTSSDSSELPVINLSTRQREQIELILQCHIKGITGKNKILKEVWGVSAGSSQAYRDAKAEYDFLIPFVKKADE